MQGTINPYIFPSPVQGVDYSSFSIGEFGSNLNSAVYQGASSKPEAAFPIAPGNPIPTAFSQGIGNQLPPPTTQKPNKPFTG